MTDEKIDDDNLKESEISPQKEPQLESSGSLIKNTSEDISQDIINIPYIMESLVESESEKMATLLLQESKYRAEIARNREQNKYKLQIHAENTKRIMIASVVVIVISGFVYASFTKDSALTDKIITALFGVGAGAGGVTLLKKDNSKPPEKKVID